MDAIPAEKFKLGEIPTKPDWFDKELADCVPRYQGHAMFKCVDGMRETAWMQDDPTYLKYTNQKLMCVPLRHEKFVRHDFKTKKNVSFKTLADANAAEGDYGHVRTLVHYERKWIGKPCWIIEVYREPKALPSKSEWERSRHDMVEVNGVARKVDLLGEYPAGGDYIYMMPVLDEHGNAIPPHQGIITECQRRYWAVDGDNRSVAQRINDDGARLEALDIKMKRQLTEEFFGEMSGLTAKRIMKDAAVSRPIRVVKQ